MENHWEAIRTIEVRSWSLNWCGIVEESDPQYTWEVEPIGFAGILEMKYKRKKSEDDVLVLAWKPEIIDIAILLRGKNNVR